MDQQRRPFLGREIIGFEDLSTKLRAIAEATNRTLRAQRPIAVTQVGWRQLTESDIIDTDQEPEAITEVLQTFAESLNDEIKPPAEPIKYQFITTGLKDYSRSTDSRFGAIITDPTLADNKAFLSLDRDFIRMRLGLEPEEAEGTVKRMVELVRLVGAGAVIFEPLTYLPREERPEAKYGRVIVGQAFYGNG